MAAHRLDSSPNQITVAELLARENSWPTEDFTVPTRRRRMASAATAVTLVAGTVLTGVTVAPEPRADPLPDDFPTEPQELIDLDHVIETELVASRAYRSQEHAAAVARERHKVYAKREAVKKERAAQEAAAAAAVTPEPTPEPQPTPEPTPEPAATPEPPVIEATGGAAIISNSAGPISARAQAAADAVVANVPGASLITLGGTRASAIDPAGHPSGNAIDYMVGGDTALGDSIVAYHLANWDALGVQYIIWQQQYLSSPGGAWEMMEDRGSTTANHYDHVHVNYLP